MNKVIAMGRLTRDPEVRYSNSDNAVARYTLAVDRPYRRQQDGEVSADFLKCVCFNSVAQFAEKYFHKGIKILITGRIQTGSYVNKSGEKVYVTEVVVENQEFAESKNSTQSASEQPAPTAPSPTSVADGFMNIPDGIDEELPFN